MQTSLLTQLICRRSGLRTDGVVSRWPLARSEFLSFLEKRPLHTAVPHGSHPRQWRSESSQSRNVLRVRNANGQLEGVALIGHAILMENRKRSSAASLRQTAETLGVSARVMCESIASISLGPLQRIRAEIRQPAGICCSNCAGQNVSTVHNYGDRYT